MTVINSIGSWWMRKRMHQIEHFMKNPYEVQSHCLNELLAVSKNTQWGKLHNYKNINNYDQFTRNVPLQNYESIKPFIKKNLRGEENILWNSKTLGFAVSSGTSNDKSKYLPISKESLNHCHYNAGRDMIAIYCSINPKSKIFDGKHLNLPGSFQLDSSGKKTNKGDLSAFVVDNLPPWVNYYSTPETAIKLINNWEEKLNKIAKLAVNENVVSLAGIPSWFILVLKQILKNTGKNSIIEVWPNIELFFHGGVNFTPYKKQLDSIFSNPNMNYLELYNASEGFFGIQDQMNSSELLLMLDYGIYYEFIEYGKESTIPLHEVKLNVNYEMVISTNAGLWRYQLGDIIMFTSLNPFRFKIIGRTQQYINAFGEELTINNADKALEIACNKTNALMKDYTAAPVYISDNDTGAHEWLIEFEEKPNSLENFIQLLDNALKGLNSDYEAKRFKNLVLKKPIVNVLPKGTFYKWFKLKNKLGGQHKIPRLSNNRKVVEEVYSILNKENNVILENELISS